MIIWLINPHILIQRFDSSMIYISIKQYIFIVNIILEDDISYSVGFYSNIDLAIKTAKKIYSKYYSQRIVIIYKCPIDESIMDHTYKIINSRFIVKTFSNVQLI